MRDLAITVGAFLCFAQLLVATIMASIILLDQVIL